MNQKEKILVAGAGAWGTAIADLLASKGFKTFIWAREKEAADSINKKRENEIFLKGFILDKRLRAVSDLNEAVQDCGIIINAVPTQHIRKVFENVSINGKRKIIVSLAKGIELETFERPSEILGKIFGKDIYVLSGPNFAAEIAAKKPAATVIAGRDADIRKKLQRIFAASYFRVYENEDIIGTETSGAVKNVIAIAAGLSDGLDLGHNARAALITRGINEIRKLGAELGAMDITFMGLAGIGDIILTCSSSNSRNYSLGKEIGKGAEISKLLSEMKHIAEGFKTSEAAYKLSRKLGIEMPITKEVYLVLHRGKKPLEALKSLMERQPKPEFK